MNQTEHHAALLEDEGVSSALLPLRRMSEEEFVAACEEKTRAEWVDGEVILMSPVNLEHASLNYWLAQVLGLFVEDRDLGLVLGQEFFIRFPAQRRRRLPDLFFVAEVKRSKLRRTFFEGAPDLMVELVSSDSVERDYDHKRKEYEAAGVREYWIIDPEKREWLPLALNKRGRYQRIAEKEGVVRSRVLDGFWLRTEWLWEPRPKVRWVLEQMEQSAE